MNIKNGLFISYFHICLFLYLGHANIWCQKRLGKQYFEVERYHDALLAWQNTKKLEKDIDLLILRGIAHYHTNNLDACISDLSVAHSKKTKDNRIFKYGALAYMSKYDYEEASLFFKSYLNTLKPKDDDYWWTIHQIKRCGLAINYSFKTPLGFVENMNNPVNTIHDERRPILSPNHTERLYFSSNRSSVTGGLRNLKGLSDEKKGIYSYDMFKTEMSQGQYEMPSIFLPLLNSPKHEILQSFSTDGHVAYYLKSKNNYQSILLADTFALDHVRINNKAHLNIPFSAEKGDRDLFWVNDSLILFSSVEHNGFGGYDIYYCQKINNQWHTPINMGPEVNSQSNEISPFLVNNGDILFFSCDKTETLGGFDIFKSVFNEDKWSEPKSLHYPINSPRDDIDIFISPDGTYGLLASNRSESIGGFDIYVVYFNEPIYEQREKTLSPPFLLINNDELRVEDDDSKLENTLGSSIERDYRSKSLIFKSGEMKLSPTNLNLIDNLTEILTLYPDLNVLLVSHTTPSESHNTDLYFSIKRTEIVIEQLLNNKIAKHRLHALGCGSGFPISQALKSGNSLKNNPINDRMEIIIMNNNYKGLKLTYDFETIIDADRPCNWNSLQKSFDGTSYKIEIAQSFISIDYKDWVSDPNVVTIEKNENNSYSYYFGIFSQLESAKLCPVSGEIIHFYKGLRQIKDATTD